ncbi:oligosaccharide flippase family protein [Patescibacteria group bacterium]|nr:oligosaccharide flippase family protein [Patescibacteria group bacterium]MBU4031152.1 oligosaccharide flippase family protein [Patescibacteria group bacterium]MCG2809045.1 oligosaccharide flippase family protein [Candidatus Portnoybacteria bacterium]
MISKFKDFTKISFVQDVGILQVGKFFSILLSVSTSVVLARLLRPELYGIYGLIFAFVGLVGIFMNWGGMYAGLTLLAGVYAKKDKQEIKNVLTYFLKITLLAVGAVGILSVFLAPFLTNLLYHNSQIGHWARMVLLATFLSVIYNFLIIVLQVLRRIKELTILETFNKFIYSLLPIVFVLLGWGLLGVVWGNFISALVLFILSIIYYFSLIKKDELLPTFRQIFSNFKQIRLKKYFNFGFSIALDKNIGNLISILPVIFLGIFASVQEVGYFKIAFGYIAIPSMLLEPVARLLTVQLPKSKTYNLQTLKNHFYKTVFYSGFISALLIIPFIILAPYLIKFFYGMEYIHSIQIVYYLAVLIIFSGFSVGLSAFYRTVNKMKISIILNIFHVAVMALLIFILVKIYSALMAVILSLIFCSAFFLALHLFVVRNIFKNEKLS